MLPLTGQDSRTLCNWKTQMSIHLSVRFPDSTLVEGGFCQNVPAPYNEIASLWKRLAAQCLYWSPVIPSGNQHSAGMTRQSL